MRFTGQVLILAALCFFSVTHLPAAPAAEAVAIEADLVQIDLDRGQTEAHGSAVLSYQELELHADRLTADQHSGQVEASGNLALTQRERRLEGDTIQYNFRTAEGLLAKAEARDRGVIIRGEKIAFSPRELVAHDAYFTTCDRPHPHYSLSAGLISLTAEQAGPGEKPQPARLSLNRAGVTYHHRRLFTVPHYSVSVSQIREPGGAPLPVTGFSRDDGPYASLSYTLGRPGSRALADFSYRYTTFRGIRGQLRLHSALGPAELSAAYVRREDISDQELRPDEIEFSLANVLVNRAPEYAIRIPDLALGEFLHLRAEWLRGTYSERFSRVVETHARGDRDSLSFLLATNPYSASPGIALSHAIGWRRSTYSPGDELTIEFFRHSVGLSPTSNTQLALSYISRHGTGETPFLFDQAGIGRELLASLRCRLSPTWRLRFENVYDLAESRTLDMTFFVTRTAHCLDYTFGWRKARGSFFIAVGLAPPVEEEAGAP